MSDLPDYIALAATSGDILSGFPAFPHRLILLPPGAKSHAILNCPGAAAMFLVEPGCIGEVLNGAALEAYLDRSVAVLILARRPRDLRPILRRATNFAERGCRVEVLNGPDAPR